MQHWTVPKNCQKPAQNSAPRGDCGSVAVRSSFDWWRHARKLQREMVAGDPASYVMGKPWNMDKFCGFSLPFSSQQWNTFVPFFPQGMPTLLLFWSMKETMEHVWHPVLHAPHLLWNWFWHHSLQKRGVIRKGLARQDEMVGPATKEVPLFLLAVLAAHTLSLCCRLLWAQQHWRRGFWPCAIHPNCQHGSPCPFGPLETSRFKQSNLTIDVNDKSWKRKQWQMVPTKTCWYSKCESIIHWTPRQNGPATWT